jgi:ketosteroid isomerase-like protein
MITIALILAAAIPAAAPPPQAITARDAIWAKEKSIYAGRGKGDLAPYLAALASGYLSWPPFDDKPKGENGIRATQRKMAGTSGETLAMTLDDFTLNGDAAIIYYHTHRSRLADGTPADETWEVIHSWVREKGEWKVLGGMARIAPKRP